MFKLKFYLLTRVNNLSQFDPPELSQLRPRQCPYTLYFPISFNHVQFPELTVLSHTSGPLRMVPAFPKTLKLFFLTTLCLCIFYCPVQIPPSLNIFLGRIRASTILCTYVYQPLSHYGITVGYLLSH